MVQLVGTTSLGLGKLIDGKNQFVHIRYSAHSNGSNMTTEIQADTKYIGIATNSSETAPTSPSDYSWGRFVGTPGASSYTWIRYSSNADGSNMTTIPNEETKYIGVAVTAEDSAPNDYTRYSWALFKGSDGRGVKKTEVSYQKSTSGTVIPTGAWLASIPSLSDGEYLWTRTLFTYTDGTTTSTYNVSRNGTSGLGIARTDVHYQKSTSGTVAPTGIWTVTIPTVRANEYLWTRTTITYTDDSTSVSYSVGKMGADGKDAQLLYLTASSQIQAFDKDNQPKTTQPITISAKLQNASGTATFMAIPYIGNTAQTPITLGGTGNDRTLLPSQWTDPKWTTIAITATLGSLTDTISVNKVKDGESGETPVVHIAWADSADGSEGFTLELPTNKIPKYRGYYVDYSTVASTDPKKYKWERNPDDTGAEVDKAMTAVESAIANAEEAERLAATASQTATIAKQEASAAQNAASMAQGEVSRIEGVIVGVQGDIDTALQEVADQAADLQATKETLETTFAKKTEVSDVQAALTTEISKKVGELQTTVSQTYAAKNDVVAMEGRLQSQITQTAGEVSSVVGKVDKLEADTTEAQKKVNEAIEKSAAAQATASQAQAYADAADRKVTAAQTDLNEAKQNLVNTINRVDATEADIAEAQLKVESAQAAVAQAQRDAAEAALAASNAQAAADKAQQDVAALTKRVTSAETAITQNSEQIKLSANKTEEIGTKLENLKVGGRNLYAQSKKNTFAGDVLGHSDTSRVLDSYGFKSVYNANKAGLSNVRLQQLQFNGITYATVSFDAYVNTGTLGISVDICDGVAKGYNISTTKTRYSLFDDNITRHNTSASYNGFVDFMFTLKEGQTFYVENVMVEYATKPSNHTPAPEDQQSQIDGINNNLTNNYYSKTQTDAAIKVASDNVTTTVRKEVTTAITNVNNKVDSIQVGGRNLARGTYGEYTAEETANVTVNENFCVFKLKTYLDGLKVGDTVSYKCIIRYTNIVVEDTKYGYARIFVQGNGNVTGWDTGTFDNRSVGERQIKISGSGEVELKGQFTVTTDMRKNQYWNTQLRIDFVRSGKIERKCFKVEKGNMYTDWSPAPEDQQSQIDNLQIGGRNILCGTKDMKLGSGKWTDGTWRQSGTGTTKNVTLTDFPLANITQGIEITSDSNDCGIAQDNLKLESGEYTLSYYVKAKTANTVVRLYPWAISAGGTYKDITLTDTNWTRVSMTGIFKSNQNSVSAGYIYAETPNSTITVAAPFEHRSNKEADWSPAPEDMATADQAQQAQNDANQANSKADATEQRVSVAESTIKQLSDSISMMVTDSNGSSMMTQTSNGWTFNIGAITSAIDSAANNIDNLSGSLDQTKNVVNNLNNLANDLSKKTAYINMTTDETGAPCIELGKTGNAFKVRITNTSVDFIQGSSKIAYVSNQALFIEKAIIKSELQIGETKGFIWKTRSNGNMGLRWFG